MPQGIKLHEVELLLNADAYGLVLMQCAPKPERPCTYVIGDLHGNALKLFVFLIWTGVVFFPAGNKDQIIFDITAAYYAKHYLSFHRAINLLQFNPEIVDLIKLIFLGDTLCDRGKSDYMTLLLFELMYAKSVKFTIILSNHDLGFIYKLNHPEEEFTVSPNDSFDIFDLDSSGTNHAKSIYQNIYLQHLEIIGYSYVGGKTLIFTHAPCDPQAIYNLAGTYAGDICSTITTTNGNTDQILRAYCESYCSTDPLGDFVENRNLTKGLPGNYVNVFGHVGDIYINASNQINLDTNAGRPDSNQTEIMLVLQVFESVPLLSNHTNSGSCHCVIL